MWDVLYMRPRSDSFPFRREGALSILLRSAELVLDLRKENRANVYTQPREASGETPPEISVPIGFRFLPVFYFLTPSLSNALAARPLYPRRTGHR